MAFSLTLKKILPIYPTRVYIEFEFNDLLSLGVPLHSLPIFIERSESNVSTTTWTLLTPGGIANYYYIDNTTQLLSFYRTTYYRGYVYVNGRKVYSETKTPSHNLARHEYLRRRKMLYDEELVLRKFMGVKIAILKRRHIGDRCDICFDPNTNIVLNSHCPKCRGTGFIAPYYEPFITYGSRTPISKSVEEATNESSHESDVSQLYMLDYPTVSPQDVIVDIETNDRYKADKIDQTEIRKELVHQIVTITKLEKASTEYNIILPKDIFKLPTTISA